MKKIAVSLLVCCLALALLTVGVAENRYSAVSFNLEDIITQHVVYMTDRADSYVEYQIIYFGSGTHTLSGLTVETHFHKDQGFTKELLDDYDVDQVYPGFNAMSFTEKAVLDDGDDLVFLCVFRNLDNPDNLQQLHDNGILTMVTPGTVADADSYIDLLKNAGAAEIPMTSYDAYGLHIGY